MLTKKTLYYLKRFWTLKICLFPFSRLSQAKVHTFAFTGYAKACSNATHKIPLSEGQILISWRFSCHSTYFWPVLFSITTKLWFSLANSRSIWQIFSPISCAYAEFYIKFFINHSAHFQNQNLVKIVQTWSVGNFWNISDEKKKLPSASSFTSNNGESPPVGPRHP